MISKHVKLYHLSGNSDRQCNFLVGPVHQADSLVLVLQLELIHPSIELLQLQVSTPFSFSRFVIPATESPAQIALSAGGPAPPPNFIWQTLDE